MRSGGLIIRVSGASRLQHQIIGCYKVQYVSEAVGAFPIGQRTKEEQGKQIYLRGFARAAILKINRFTSLDIPKIAVVI